MNFNKIIKELNKKEKIEKIIYGKKYIFIKKKDKIIFYEKKLDTILINKNLYF